MGLGLLEGSYPRLTSCLLYPTLGSQRFCCRRRDTVGHELEMEKKGGNGGGKETGVDRVMDTQIPLGPEAFSHRWGD